jgi:uncharacterized heparinase superfamily protein
MKPGPAAYWNTMRHLRPVQLYGRVLSRLLRPRPDLAPPPPLRSPGAVFWPPPALREPSLLGPDRIRLLNETRVLTDGGWEDQTASRLWRYHLHYFDDLNAREAASRAEWHRTLLRRWVAENPPPAGTGWEPYPTARRMVNWIKWSLGGHPLPAECVQSLAVQARWLRRRLEMHLLGNHLLADAKALVFAGFFFEGSEAQGWLERGMTILGRELREQILPDGGHFERSTMYHALTLEDVLDLYNVSNVYKSALPAARSSVFALPASQFRLLVLRSERIDAMRDWLAAMCHPDGEIGFFNDAAIGVAPAPMELDSYARRLGLTDRAPAGSELVHLRESGYLRITQPDMVALIDAAPLGPDYLPGHAHADTLSFELSLFGSRLLVNSGTSTYEAGAERDRQRGTAAHNTVLVDGRDSSEVWASFRVARRARPIGLELSRGDGIEVRCSHDGYRHLPGRPRPSRRWLFRNGTLAVEDEIAGSFGQAEARFHLHPDVRPEVEDGARSGRLVLPDGRGVQWLVEEGEPAIEPSTYHPQFGLSVPSCCLVNRCRRGRSRLRLRWS